jgi:hypothetical protein
MAWKHPGTFTTLGLGATGYTNVFCSSVSAGVAGCGATDATAHPVVIRLPLNGATPVTTVLAKSACPDAVFVTAAATAWTDGCSRTLNSVPAATGTPVSTNSAYVQEGAGLVGAFGELVTSIDVGTGFVLDETSDATGARHVLVSLQHSVVVAAHIAITAGRVAYDDDQTSAVGTWSRVVRGSATTVTVGAAKSLGHPGVGADIVSGGGPYLSISGANTASAGMTRSMTIDSPVGTSTLRTKTPVTDVDLSGDRMTFDVGAQQRPALYDLLTGTMTRVPHAVSASIWGNYLAYAKANGSVWRQQLGGHHAPVRLRGPVSGTQRNGIFVQVFSFGDEVAWQLEVQLPTPPFQVAHDGVRDAQTMAPAQAIPDTDFPRAATSDGVLEQHYVGNHVRYYLQPYGSTHRTLVVSVPETGLLVGEPDNLAVDGDRIAWIDGNNRARIAALPVIASPDPPRYLGDPLAPTTLARGAKNPWQAFIPLSAALTSCSVTIFEQATVVRTLRCTKAAARLGDAAVSWNGQNSAGREVKAATYRWVLNAANSAGTALAANGSTRPIAGRIVVH